MKLLYRLAAKMRSRRRYSDGFIVNLLVILPARVASLFAWAGPLVMRLVVGYVFMLSGWTKLNNLPQMI